MSPQSAQQHAESLLIIHSDGLSRSWEKQFSIGHATALGLRVESPKDVITDIQRRKFRRADKTLYVARRRAPTGSFPKHGLPSNSNNTIARDSP